MEFMEIIKMFDLIFAFVFFLGLICASFTYAMLEIISGICDYVKTNHRERREKRESEAE